MSWVAVYLVFVICHLVGDFGLQTEWQAMNKSLGLGRDPVSRRALASHVISYAAAFVPACVWIGANTNAAWAGAAAILIVLPHAIQDDRRVMVWYARTVKRMEPDDEPVVMLALDQTVHLVGLFLVALLVSAA